MNKEKKTIFWGTPEFAVPSLEILVKKNLVEAVVTQPDKGSGRGKKILSSPVKQLAEENSLPVLQFNNLDDSFVTELKKYLPATFVIVAYGKIIPLEILDLSEKTAVNIHPSQLPELRGPSPIQTAILRGFKATAVSLMQLDEKMDHGPILGQIQANISPNDDYLTLSTRLAALGAEILDKKIVDYLEDKLTPLPQDDSQATFCQLLKKEDGQIDWSKSAEEVNNQIRAFVMWPGSFTKLKDVEVKVTKSKVVEEKLAPGEILIDGRLIVGCGGKSLEILEIQPAGKKVMTAEEFIRGYGDRVK